MELRHLRYFLSVAEASSFSRAAEAMNVSQPALSQQIRQLEDELRAPLFDRLGKSVRLTPAGEILSRTARQVLRQVAEGESAIRELDALARGSLAVGAMQTINSYLVPAVVSRFRSRYPHVSVRVDELPADGIEAGLLDGTLDVGLGFVPARDPAMQVEKLFDEELVLVVAATHRLARRRALALRDLGGEPLILLPDTHCTRRLIDHSFDRVRTSPSVAVEMDSIEGILATVRSSGGATILPILSARRAGEEVRTIRLQRPTPRRTVGLVWLAGAHRTAAAKAFADEVRQLQFERLETALMAPRRSPTS